MGIDDGGTGVAFIDGLFFDPTGQFLLVTARLPYKGLVVVSRTDNVAQKNKRGHGRPARPGEEQEQAAV